MWCVMRVTRLSEVGEETSEDGADEASLHADDASGVAGLRGRSAGLG